MDSTRFALDHIAFPQGKDPGGHPEGLARNDDMTKHAFQRQLVTNEGDDRWVVLRKKICSERGLGTGDRKQEDRVGHRGEVGEAASEGV